MELRILELVALNNEFHIYFYIESNNHKQLKTLPVYNRMFRVLQIMKKHSLREVSKHGVFLIRIQENTDQK